MELSFGHIEIFVKEPLISAEFYTGILGFELETVQHNKFVWLISGTCTVLLRPGNNTSAAPDYPSAKNGFVLYTNDLENTRNELTKRGLVFKGTDGSDKCLTFTDPDGNWFQLVNPNDH